MKLPLLFSYAYEKSIDWDAVLREEKDLDILIDSGAFTTFKQGKPMDIQAYMTWLHETRFKKYFTLDVIGDHYETRQNFLHMQAGGLKPIPIFTRGAPLEDLEFYYGRNPSIAIGGIQMKAGNATGYLKHLQPHINKRPVHWLGYCIHDHMLAWRPTSVDSINWKSAILFGRMQLFKGGRLLSIPRNEVWKYRTDVENLGFDPDALATPEAWKGAESLAHHITALSHLNYVTTLHARTGVTFYLGVNNNIEFRVILEAYHKQQRNQK